MNPVIVYLAQNSERDHQYGRDARSNLEKSLRLLYENYNNRFKHPVLIFHEGDFTEEDQRQVADGRGEIRFEQIRFEIPEFLRDEQIPETWEGFHRYGMGHRHMIRFYSIQIFDILTEMGFDWYFRMDDDSFFHSPITYDLFEFMARNGLDYGYRVDVQDGLDVCNGFGETVVAYLISEKIKPSFFYDHMKRYPAPRFLADRALNALKNQVKAALMRRDPSKNYLRWDWPPTPGYVRGAMYDRWGYYNNFHITRLGFWKSPEVQAFLHHMDRIGGGYKYRWNDLVLQSAVVQIFMPKSKVHKFTDWTYEHATIKGGKLFFGGIYEGSSDPNSKAVAAFKKVYGRTHTKQTY